MKGEWKPELTNAEHHGSGFITSSSLKRALSTSMAGWKKAQEEGTKDNDNLRLGRLIHLAVFEPEKWDDEVIAPPTKEDGSTLHKRSKDDKATWAKFYTKLHASGKDFASPEEKAKCFAISASVRANKDAAKWLKSGIAEVSGVVESEDYGKMAIRPDWRCADRQVIIDLKSCQSAAPADVMKTVANFGYHTQAAFYVDLARVIDKIDYDFVWIFAEKEPPYSVACYCATPEVLEVGRGSSENEVGYEGALGKITRAKATGEYPASYFEGTMPVKLPNWAK